MMYFPYFYDRHAFFAFWRSGEVVSNPVQLVRRDSAFGPVASSVRRLFHCHFDVRGTGQPQDELFIGDVLHPINQWSGVDVCLATG